MATIRINPTCVQVDALEYNFADVDAADDFEACVAVSDAEHCKKIAAGKLLEVVAVKDRAALGDNAATVAPMTSAMGTQATLT